MRYGERIDRERRQGGCIGRDERHGIRDRCAFIRRHLDTRRAVRRRHGDSYRLTFLTRHRHYRHRRLVPYQRIIQLLRHETAQGIAVQINHLQQGIRRFLHLHREGIHPGGAVPCRHGQTNGHQGRIDGHSYLLVAITRDIGHLRHTGRTGG